MIFLPHTNTVVLLEPYCGTITEPGLPVGFETDRVAFFSSVVRFRLVILVFFLVFCLLFRFFPQHQIFPTEVTIFFVSSFLLV